MPDQNLSHLKDLPENTEPLRNPFSPLITFLILFLSILTVLGALVPLFSLDFEVVLFLRSIQFQSIEEMGRIGHEIGNGLTLILISIGLGLIGYIWKSNRFKQAGWQSLIAHLVAGLIIQVIKILLGRPRPHFTHQDQWQLGPAIQDGLNTFPSGHSTASFAVATVLARYFPKGTWIWYGIAGFVAVSRIMRGSHFPSDVLTGALIGFLVGSVFASPLKNWFISLIDALSKGLPYWVGGFALVWITFHYPGTGPFHTGMFWLGLTMIVLTYVARVFFLLDPPKITFRNEMKLQTINLLMGLGLALYTESLIVTLLALISSILWWIAYSQNETRGISPTPSDAMRSNGPVQEAMVGMAMLVLLLGIHQIKGLIPMQ